MSAAKIGAVGGESCRRRELPKISKRQATVADTTTGNTLGKQRCHEDDIRHHVHYAQVVVALNDACQVLESCDRSHLGVI